MKKQNIVHLSSSSSLSSNKVWILVFCAIAATAFIPQMIILKVPIFKAIFSVFAVLAYPIFFATYCEGFYLLKHPRRNALMWTILLILWLFLPIFGMITESIFLAKDIPIFFAAPSPAFGLKPLIDTMQYPNSDITFNALIVAGIKWGMVIIAALFAHTQRQKLRLEVAKNLTAK